MISRSNRYILKAFLHSKMPRIAKPFPELILLDSFIAGYCDQAIKTGRVKLIANEDIVSKEEKKIFSHLINISEGDERKELIIYYKLLTLTEAIINQYKST